MSARVFHPALPVSDALAMIEDALAGHGIEEPRREARLLLRLALGLSLAALVADPKRVIGQNHNRVALFTTRRAAGEPLSRILGLREFYGLDFALSRETLDPRPETELLVDAGLAHLAIRPAGSRAARICDLGTGTGAILIALLVQRPEATGLGIDISADALETARRNAETHGVVQRTEFRQGDLRSEQFDLSDGSGGFDLIVSNPPYIPRGDLATLPREVRIHDPSIALDGGEDGLEFYRRIVAGAPRWLQGGAMLAFEVGAGQARDVAAMMERAGFLAISIRPDFAGIERIVTAVRSPNV